MSVNFNPSLSFKPANAGHNKMTSAQTQEYQRQMNEAIQKHRINNSRDTFERLNYTPAQVDALTAATAIVMAKILKEQEKFAVPEEIIISSQEAEKACSRATDTAARALDKADEIIAAFESKESTGADGEILRIISETDEDGNQTMTEFSPEGEIIRESEFENGIPKKATEFNEDGTKNIINFRKGTIEEYIENFKHTETGKYRSAYMTFDGKNPSVYYENYEEFNNGGSKTNTAVTFNNGNMAAYYKDMNCFEDYSSLIGLHLRYDENGVLNEHAEEIKDGIVKGKHWVLENFRWINKNAEKAL